jgi:hypothetical protein
MAKGSPKVLIVVVKLLGLMRIDSVPQCVYGMVIDLEGLIIAFLNAFRVPHIALNLTNKVCTLLAYKQRAFLEQRDSLYNAVIHFVISVNRVYTASL